MMERVLSRVESTASPHGHTLFHLGANCGRAGALYLDNFSRGETSDDAKIGILTHEILAAYHTNVKLILELDDTYSDKVVQEVNRLRDFYVTHRPPDLFGKVLATERLIPKDDEEAAKLLLELDGPVSGRIDLVCEMDEDDIKRWNGYGVPLPGPGVYFVDHKTSKQKRGDIELRQRLDIQFLQYYIAGSIVLPYDVRGTITNNITRHKNLDPERSIYFNFIPAPLPYEIEAYKEWFSRTWERIGAAQVNLDACKGEFRICPFSESGACTRI